MAGKEDNKRIIVSRPIVGSRCPQLLGLLLLAVPAGIAILLTFVTWRQGERSCWFRHKAVCDWRKRDTLSGLTSAGTSMSYGLPTSLNML